MWNAITNEVGEIDITNKFNYDLLCEQLKAMTNKNKTYEINGQKIT